MTLIKPENAGDRSKVAVKGLSLSYSESKQAFYTQKLDKIEKYIPLLQHFIKQKTNISMM